MLSKNSNIHKILVISLSNIGDVILTFPVVDILKENFPEAKLSIVVGPKAESLFWANPYFGKVYIYDKRQPLAKTLRWLWELRKENFDLVVDLRNSAVPFFIAPRFRTPFVIKKEETAHMKQKHLRHLKMVYPFEREAQKKYSIYVSEKDKGFIDQLIQEKTGAQTKFAVIAAGAANQDKRWTEEGFRELADKLIERHGLKIVFVGDGKDREITERIAGSMLNPSLNLCGRLTLIQLAELFQRSAFVAANDSAPMHLASYLDRPAAAIFGPSDPQKYGPWGLNSFYIQKNGSCLKCQDKNSQEKHTCMQAITSSDVLQALKGLV